MAKVDLTTLKSKFETGDTPNGADFVDLIDSLEDAGAFAVADAAITASLATKADKTPFTETKTAPAIAGGALALNCAYGNVFAVALNANVTSLSFSGAPAAGSAIGITVAFTADGTARTIAWPASVKWAGGTAPTLTSTAGKVDIFVFCTWDSGTTWYACIAGQNM